VDLISVVGDWRDACDCCFGVVLLLFMTTHISALIMMMVMMVMMVHVSLVV
jgi:hypothetical protein